MILAFGVVTATPSVVMVSVPLKVTQPLTVIGSNRSAEVMICDEVPMTRFPIWSG